MYHEFFGLSQAPFKITPDTRLFFPGGSRGEILEALVYAIDTGEGITKLVGEVGSGKTMLCRMLELRLPETVEIAYLVNPSLGPGDILYAIALEIGIDVDSNTNRVHVMQALHHKLLEKHAAGKQVVVFVEEAQSMPHETLEEIRLLSNLETQQSKLLQIVLFGQPELDKHLDEPGIRQLRERITHSFYLTPFDKDEIKKYIRFRLQAVGYRGPDMFEDDAYKELARASLGLTRRVNILADKSLLAAFAENTHNVSRRHVRVAIQDSELNTRQGLRWPRYAVAAGLCGVALGVGGFLTAGSDFNLRDALMSGVNTVSGYIVDSNESPVAGGAKVETQPAQAVKTTAQAATVDTEPVIEDTEASYTPEHTGGGAPPTGAEPNAMSAPVASIATELSQASTPSAETSAVTEAPDSRPVTESQPALGESPDAEPAASPGSLSQSGADSSPVGTAATEPARSYPEEPEQTATQAGSPMLEPTAVADPPASPEPMEQAPVMAQTEATTAVEPAPGATPTTTAVAVMADDEEPQDLREQSSAQDTIQPQNVAAPDERVSSAAGNTRLVAQRLDAARVWLQEVNKNYYTIQLLATEARQAKRLEDLLRSWRERGTIDRVYIYQTKVGNGVWYGVLYDDYETFAKARAALEDLPAEVKRYKPFIRNVRDLGSFG